MAREIGRIPGAEAVHDVVFRTASGRTCQVDHIVRLRGRILAVETKNWAGRICPSDGHRWTVIRPGGGAWRPFSPVIQNAGHRRTLERALGIAVGGTVVLAGRGLLAEPVDGVTHLGSLRGELERRAAAMPRPPRSAGAAAWRTVRGWSRPRVQRRLRAAHARDMERRHGRKPWTKWWLVAAAATLVSAAASPGPLPRASVPLARPAHPSAIHPARHGTPHPCGHGHAPNRACPRR